MDLNSRETDDILCEMETCRYCDSKQKYLCDLVDELVRRKVYPQTPFMDSRGISPLQMVTYYGARWHLWGEPTNCSKCGYDFRDRDLGPPFKKEIAISSLELDRVTHLVCPGCNAKFDRDKFEI